MLGQSFPNGVYNVGSGEARSWMDLANAMFVALDREIKVELKDMPEDLEPGTNISRKPTWIS